MEETNMENEVVFKSWEDYFALEESGAKNNTARLVKMWERKFQILAAMRLSGKYGIIDIKEVDHEGIETGNSFRRQITDVTFWDKFAIISWRSP